MPGSRTIRAGADSYSIFSLAASLKKMAPTRLTDFYLSPGRSYLLAGSSGSGKTTWALELVRQLVTWHADQVKMVHIFYEVYQEAYENVGALPVRLHDNLHDLTQMSDDEMQSCVIIIDDQLENLKGDRLNAVNRLYTIVSHHKQVTVLLCVQNLFPTDSVLRTVLKNCSFVIVFKSQQASLTLATLQRVYFPGLQKILNRAAAHAFAVNNYLVIDMVTDSAYILKTGVLNEPIGHSFAYAIQH